MEAAPLLVDTHLHFWDPAVIDYFWLAQATPALNRKIGLDELEPDRLAAGVTHGVFVQASHDLRELGWVLAELGRFPWVCGVVGWLDLTSPDFRQQAQQAMRDPRFKGVRHLTHDIPGAGWLAGDDVGAGLEVLARLGLSLDLVLRPDQLGRAAEVVRHRPGLNVILDHLGNPPLAGGDLGAWARDLEALAALPNVTAKVSGLLTLLAADEDHALLQDAVHLAFGLFGAGRLMFGGDWPVSAQAASYPDTLETLRSVLPPLRPEERQAFWGGTADRIYRLGLSDSPRLEQEVYS